MVRIRIGVLAGFSLRLVLEPGQHLPGEDLMHFLVQDLQRVPAAIRTIHHGQVARHQHKFIVKR